MKGMLFVFEFHIFQIDITDKQRGEVKQVCYALMYGSGSYVHAFISFFHSIFIRLPYFDLHIILIIVLSHYLIFMLHDSCCPFSVFMFLFHIQLFSFRFLPFLGDARNAESLGMTELEARKLKKEFLLKHPALTEFRQSVIKSCRYVPTYSI